MREKRRYAAVMDRWEHPPREVAAGEFLTQHEAARGLRCSVRLVGLLVACGRLHPATLAGAPGVTRESYAAERARRDRPLWRLRVLGAAFARYL